MAGNLRTSTISFCPQGQFQLPPKVSSLFLLGPKPSGHFPIFNILWCPIFHLHYNPQAISQFSTFQYARYFSYLYNSMLLCPEDNFFQAILPKQISQWLLAWQELEHWAIIHFWDNHLFSCDKKSMMRC